MTIRKRITPGDLVAVPLDNGMVAVGIVLHVSKIFRNSMLVGFYDLAFKSVEEVAIPSLPPAFVFVPNYTSQQLVRNGRWQIIGSRLELLEAATIPHLRVGTDIYYKDEVVHHFSSTEEDKALKYPRLEGLGGGWIENKLRKHFRDKDDKLADL